MRDNTRYPAVRGERARRSPLEIGRRARQLLFVWAVLLCGSSACAHALLDHADPRVGSTVGKPPSAVDIWFTQEPEPSFSRIEVYDSDGKQVDSKDTHVDQKDPKQLIVSLPALPAGTYKVVWHVVSSDTHKTQGDFKFSVKP